MAHVQQRVVSVGARPHRMAAFVGDIGEALQVVDMYSGCWGGGRNLILPMPTTEDLLRGLWGVLLWRHDPDIIVIGEGGAPSELSLECVRRTRAELWELRHVLPGENCCFTLFEDCVPPAFNAGAHSASVVKEGTRIYACPRETDGVSPWAAATLGYVYREDLHRFEAVGAEVIQVKDMLEDWQGCLNATLRLDGHITIRDVTRAHLRFARVERPQSNKITLVVSQEANVTDLSLAWDFGALPGASINDYLSTMWVPARVLEDEALLDELIAGVKRHALTQRSVRPGVDLHVHSSSLDPEELDELLDGKCERWNGQQTIIKFGRDADCYSELPDDWRPVYFPNADLLPGEWLEFAGRPTRRSTIFVDGVGGLEVEAPEWAPADRALNVTYDIMAEGLCLPPTRDLEGILPWKCSASKAGVTTHLHAVPGGTSLTLRWPNATHALASAFGQHGLKLQPSDKAVYVGGVIELMGGLEHCALLRNKATVKLLEAMTPGKLTRRLKDIAAARQIGQNETQVIRELLPYIRDTEWRAWQADVATLKNATELDKASIVEALDELARVNGIVRGFELRCDNCQRSAWYEYHVPLDGFECEACGYRNPPRVGGCDSQAEAGWSYRLARQLDLAVDQGVLPIIQLLALLREKHGEKLVYVPGAEISCLPEEEVISEFEGPIISIRETRHHRLPQDLRAVFEQKREIDLIACTDGQLVVAEVKSTGQHLEQDEVDACLQIAKEFVFGRAMFACMDTFPEEIQGMIDERCSTIGHPRELVDVYDGTDLLTD